MDPLQSPKVCCLVTIQGATKLVGFQLTEEPSTSGRVLAPVPTLLATPVPTLLAIHNRGNHGGIAPT